MLKAMVSSKYLRFYLLVSLMLNSALILRIYHSSSTDLKDSSSAVLAPGMSPHYRRGNNEESNRKSHLTSSISKQYLQQELAPPLELQQVIFVGGVPRSGTTLVRVMLDAHPDIRCGEETRVIPRLLAMRNRWNQEGKEHSRLVEAGMKEKLLDNATRAFISTIIQGHGSPAPFLCNKDPLVLNYMADANRLYPKAKFVMLIRDGRAVAYSIISRNVTISGVNPRSYVSAAKFWNKVMTKMTQYCDGMGPEKCMELYYERLVQNPQEWMEKVLKFLGIPWHDNVLQHHTLINKEIVLSK